MPNFMTERFQIVVPQTIIRQRLEEFLFDRFGGLSRMYLREIVREGSCEVNDRNENVGYRVRGGDFIEIELDTQRQNSMKPENIPFEVLYEDSFLLAVNKPSGMLVHPTHRDKSGTLLNALAYYLNDHPDIKTGRKKHIRAGLVHRLDQDTSGVLIVSKDPLTHRRLSIQLTKKFFKKRYFALVEGTILADRGIIDAPIGRYEELKYWDIKSDGKQAVTKFWVKRRNRNTTLIELEPVTGRTNQLRIHCQYLGHPIVGDKTRNGMPFERLCLHSRLVEFKHPTTREIISAESDPSGFYDDPLD